MSRNKAELEVAYIQAEQNSDLGAAIQIMKEWEELEEQENE